MLLHSNNITGSTLPLVITNKIWLIHQDPTATVYCTEIKQSSNTFVRTVTGITLHNLWHHRLFHTSKFCTGNINKVGECVPSLYTPKNFKIFQACNSKTQYVKLLTLGKKSDVKALKYPLIS